MIAIISSAATAPMRFAAANPVYVLAVFVLAVSVLVLLSERGQS